MTFETFKITYLVISFAATSVPLWLLRKSRDDLLILGSLSLISLSFFIALYLHAAQHIPDTLIEEHIFRALTHIKADLSLTVCNALLWVTFPIGIGMFLRNMKYGMRLVWIFFAVFTLLKTFFEDYFLNHTYPETLVHSYEWDSVLLAWVIIYSLVALFITKGIDLLSEMNNDDKSNH
jgi:hypothetical protein